MRPPYHTVTSIADLVGFPLGDKLWFYLYCRPYRIIDHDDLIVLHPIEVSTGMKMLTEDPIFMDPDADQPRVLIEAQKQEIIDEMHQIILDAGIDSAFAYSLRKTGFLLIEENIQYMTPAELAEWNDAIEEYRCNEGRVR
jgi:hypothetical protein